MRTSPSLDPRVAGKQIAFYAVGWADAMPGNRGRRSFDVSAMLFRTMGGAQAYNANKVTAVFTFYADNQAELDQVFAQHEDYQARHRKALGYED